MNLNFITWSLGYDKYMTILLPAWLEEVMTCFDKVIYAAFIATSLLQGKTFRYKDSSRIRIPKSTSDYTSLQHIQYSTKTLPLWKFIFNKNKFCGGLSFL
jgi:hypothetical protein